MIQTWRNIDAKFEQNSISYFGKVRKIATDCMKRLQNNKLHLTLCLFVLFQPCKPKDLTKFAPAV